VKWLTVSIIAVTDPAPFKSRSRSDVIESFLSLGADPCYRDAQGYSTLYYAFKNKMYPLVYSALKAGASVDMLIDPQNNALLHYFATDDELENFLKHTPNMNIKNANGDTPLHILCSAEHTPYEKVKLMIDHGANPNATNNNGRTPAHCLVYTKGGSCTRLLGLLLKAKADFHLKDSEEKTVLDIAELSEVFLIKHKFKAPPNNPLGSDFNLNDELGGMWSMRIGSRWGIISFRRKHKMHDWKIYIDFGYVCKVKRYHFKQTLLGTTRMKFKFLGFDEEDEREVENGTGWLEV
jgi:hypothetical protein